MTARVRECLLHDPIGGQVDARCERRRIALECQPHGRSGGACAVDQLGQPVEPWPGRPRGLEAAFRAEDAEQPPQLGEGVPCGLADRGKALLALVRHVRRGQARRLRLDGDHRHVVCHDVVQPARCGHALP